MSVEPMAPHREVQVAYVPVDRLLFHPRNIRKDLGDLRELADSIATQGVLQPVRAERRGDTLRLLAGHRRVAAARLVGLKKVPCVVVGEHEDDEAIVTMLTENLNRSGLTHDEKRQAVKTLSDEFGMTKRGIAQRLGVSEVTIYNWLQDPAAKAPKSRPESLKARVTPGHVYRLIQRWEDQAPAELIAELRELIQGWEPSPRATRGPQKDPTSSVSQAAVEKVRMHDRPYKTVPQLALETGLNERVIARARKVIREAS